jgi:hypothetical protein
MVLGERLCQDQCRHSATTAQHAAGAPAVAAATSGGRAVGSPGEIGALAFYCDCRIVDLFSDRGDAATGLRSGCASPRSSSRQRAAFQEANGPLLNRQQAGIEK